ncbi:hypothetical protein [Leucobacter sp. GX24907]
MSTDDKTSQPTDTVPLENDRPGGAAPTATDPTETRRSVPRTGPIIWGVLILAFCAYVTQRSLAPDTVDTTVWATGTLLGLGAVLLLVGLGLLFRRNR